MVTLILLIIDTKILFILHFISSYFITLELYIRPSNTMTLFKTITATTTAATTITITVIIIIIIIMISTTIFQKITEKLDKMTYFVLTILGVLLPPKVLYGTQR